jgi:hypothetical protein
MDNDISPWGGKPGRSIWVVVGIGLLLLTLILFGTSCRSDKAFVADQTASHHYHYARYEHECLAVTPEQQQFKDDVNEQLRQVRILNETQQIGKLPPEAKKESREQAKKVKGDKCT